MVFFSEELMMKLYDEMPIRFLTVYKDRGDSSVVLRQDKLTLKGTHWQSFTVQTTGGILFLLQNKSGVFIFKLLPTLP